MTRFAALLSLALLLAGCPAPAEVEPTGGAGQSMMTPELAAARQLWQAAGLQGYSMTLSRSCYCPTPDYTGPFTVEVQDQAVAEVRLSGAVVERERGLSVEDLFALLEEAYARGAERIDVAYDPELGYPSRLFIDYSTRMADEEIGYQVSNVQPSNR